MASSSSGCHGLSSSKALVVATKARHAQSRLDAGRPAVEDRNPLHDRLDRMEKHCFQSISVSFTSFPCISMQETGSETSSRGSCWPSGTLKHSRGPERSLRIHPPTSGIPGVAAETRKRAHAPMFINSKWTKMP